MVFSSPIFLYVFLPLVLAGYFVCSGSGRNVFLVAVSLIFYAWGEGGYVLLMLASVGFNFLVGLGIGAERRRRRAFLGIGVCGNLLALAYFKYWGFAFDAISDLFGLEVEPHPVHLPLGISFFTFQAISYLVDVYRGQAEAQRNPLNVALYIMLFPQLIAGPIVRYQSVAWAISSRRSTLEGVTSGIELFIVGLGKKMLLANPMGEVADAAFALDGSALTPGVAWLGALAFALQIYFDFSGYTDMARGLGRVFGFEFPVNFRLPYLSTSVGDFWRRWHISLSTWFRDYLYVPLGGSRAGKGREIVNLWIVFLLCGLWHGASWTFVVWGALHGAWMTLERSSAGKLLASAPTPLRWLLTFVFLLCSWTFFRANALSQGWEFVGSMLAGRGFGAPHAVQVLELLDMRFWLVLGIALFVAWGGHELVLRVFRHPGIGGVRAWLFPARFAALLAVMVLSFARLAVDQYNPFIYFRF